MSDPASPTAPEANAPAVESAPAAPAAAAAPAAEAPPAKKTGFLASLVGGGNKIAELQSAIEERDSKIIDLQSRVAEYEKNEQLLEAQMQAAEKATTEAVAAKEEVPKTVAAKVVDTVESLGLDPEQLPASESKPPGPDKSGEFSHLKGREKVAAAFAAQFETA